MRTILLGPCLVPWERRSAHDTAPLPRAQHELADCPRRHELVFKCLQEHIYRSTFRVSRFRWEAGITVPVLESLSWALRVE